MSKELNGLSDRVLSHWFPMRKVPRMCGQEDHTMKEAWKGKAQPKKDVIQPGDAELVFCMPNACKNKGAFPLRS